MDFNKLTSTEKWKARNEHITTIEMLKSFPLEFTCQEILSMLYERYYHIDNSWVETIKNEPTEEDVDGHIQTH